MAVPRIDLIVVLCLATSRHHVIKVPDCRTACKVRTALFLLAIYLAVCAAQQGHAGDALRPRCCVTVQQLFLRAPASPQELAGNPRAAAVRSLSLLRSLSKVGVLVYYLLVQLYV